MLISKKNIKINNSDNIYCNYKESDFGEDWRIFKKAKVIRW